MNRRLGLQLLLRLFFRLDGEILEKGRRQLLSSVESPLHFHRQPMVKSFLGHIGGQWDGGNS